MTYLQTDKRDKTIKDVLHYSQRWLSLLIFSQSDHGLPEDLATCNSSTADFLLKKLKNSNSKQIYHNLKQ